MQALSFFCVQIPLLWLVTNAVERKIFPQAS